MIDCPLLSTCNVISADTFFNNWEFLLEHYGNNDDLLYHPCQTICVRENLSDNQD